MTTSPTHSRCQQCGDPITATRGCKSKRAALCSKCFKRLYDKDYREAHKERYKEYAQKYYQANREKLRDKNTVQKRVWRDANRLHYRDYQRNYKRRIRSGADYVWEQLPTRCSGCGDDISERWGTKSRREGLCPRCYRRKAQAEYYHALKAVKQCQSQEERRNGAQAKEVAVVD